MSEKLQAMYTDFERCVRAVQSKDARFDGWFFTAVSSTGIYCRPGCPVPAPKPENMGFYPSAAAAQQAGFRACKRCRPDASPGSPQWNERADVVARAMRLIGDGTIDRDGVGGLAAQLNYSVRQVERQLQAELGAGPLALARAQRAQTARILIETTPLAFADIAFAAGFESIRTFNTTIREVFASTPSQLRAKRRGTAGVDGAQAVAKAAPSSALTTISLRLAFRKPFSPSNLFGHLAATAVPGVEEWRDGAYRRTLRLAHGYGIVTVSPQADFVSCELSVSDMRDVASAVARVRWMLDLDADPVAIDGLLSEDPFLAPLVAKEPGRRVPHTVDPHEFAIRAVLGQQVSTKAARTHAGRLVATYGEPIDDPVGGLTHLFPTVQMLKSLEPEDLAMPQKRRETVRTLVQALIDGTVVLDVGSDWGVVREQLLELPGMGPWTVESIAMRALGDPDAFIPSDLGVKYAAAGVGLPVSPAALTKHAARWQPWRAYAVQYLWATGDHPINTFPVKDSVKEGKI